jgi:hypothetical protein
MMAPESPTDFVERPAEFDALKKELLDSKGDAVAITAALRGAGGYGKTTLAKALARDPDIQDAYFDGILWVELGQRPENLLANISDLITRLTGTPPGLETIMRRHPRWAKHLGTGEFCWSSMTCGAALVPARWPQYDEIDHHAHRQRLAYERCATAG